MPLFSKLFFTWILMGFCGFNVMLWGVTHAEEVLVEVEPIESTALNPLWHRCSSAQDCSIIRGFCGYPEAVNTEHKEAYLQWIKVGPPAHCALLAPVNKICVTCKKATCTARSERATSGSEIENEKPEKQDALNSLIRKLDR